MKVEQLNISCLKALGVLLMVITAILFACVLLPSNAHADEIVAHSVDDSGNTVANFYSTGEAIGAGYSTKNAIVMDQDWWFRNTWSIPEDKSITIDMNGHRIVNFGGETAVRLCENSNLTLKSTTKTKIFYIPFPNEDCNKDFKTAYSNKDGDQANPATETDGLITGKDWRRPDHTIETGGLITGGVSGDEAGGICMDDSSTLTLDNVSIAANTGGCAGGIFVKEDCKIFMKNDAKIEKNRGKTGGIFVDGENTKVDMNNSSISNNQGNDKSGGIYADASDISIKMENGSKMTNNIGKLAGAVYFCETFSIVSCDKTAVLSDNNVDSGVIGSAVACDSEGLISGLTIKNNLGHGAVALDQGDARVADCTIVDNVGCGVWVNGSDCSITSCTIRGNVLEASGEKGAGVRVAKGEDIRISGKCYIYDNWNKDKTRQMNVYLNNESFFTNSYITGGVDSGSKVGVSSNIRDDFRFGQDITNYSYGTYFIDDPGYYVSKGDDCGGDLWQREGRLRFMAKVNGVEQRHAQGETVTISKKNLSGNKHFWYWDLKKATGLYPISDFINEETKYNPTISFEMPQNDVNLEFADADYVTSCTVGVERPKAGRELFPTATLTRTDNGVGAQGTIEDISLTWYELNADGTRSAVRGYAETGKKYVATVSIAEQQKLGLFFSQDITADCITVDTSILRPIAPMSDILEQWQNRNNIKVNSASASVDKATGTLTVETPVFAL